MQVPVLEQYTQKATGSPHWILQYFFRQLSGKSMFVNAGTGYLVWQISFIVSDKESKKNTVFHLILVLKRHWANYGPESGFSVPGFYRNIKVNQKYVEINIETTWYPYRYYVI
jgi:hypothetical protein